MSKDYKGTSLLVRHLDQLRASGNDADVTILIGKSAERFEAHSIILAARCPSMRRAIEETVGAGRQLKLTPTTQLVYEDIAPSIFEKVWKYFYTGRIRLGSSYVFDVLALAVRFELERLEKICVSYIDRSADEYHIVDYLTQAVRSKSSAVYNRLGCILSLKSKDVFFHSSFLSAPQDMVELLLKQESLKVTEDEILIALIRWAHYQAEKSPTANNSEHDAIAHDYLRSFLRPGLVRLMNVKVESVASMVEPLGIASRAEILKKYRFDAVSRSAPFSLAFPYPKSDFLTRTRDHMQILESEHPHPRGADYVNKIMMPSWVTMIEISFDAQCELARYADVTFYTEEDLSTSRGSLCSLLAERRNSMGTPQVPLRLTIPGRRLWVKFYSPNSYDPGWGYKFKAQGVCNGLLSCTG